MNIIVRNMIRSDIEDLSRAFAAQGWLVPSSVFDHHYQGMLKRTDDMLVAETYGEPAGFVRMQWLCAGDEYGGALAPEIKEFVVLEKYTGMGVAEALIAEAERRVDSRTGEESGNALMAVYCAPPSRPPFRCSFVLDGLLVGHDGRFIRAKNAANAGKGVMLCMKVSRRM